MNRSIYLRSALGLTATAILAIWNRSSLCARRLCSVGWGWLWWRRRVSRFWWRRRWWLSRLWW